MPSFPDVNVWFALAIEEHVHHPSANAWWQRQDESILFCRITQLGLLRLLTTPAIMAGKPLTMRLAWRVYDRFAADDRVTFSDEPSAAVDPRFRDYSSCMQSSPKAWADSYLLALAEASGSTLVTFDQALAKRAGELQTVLLT